MSGSYRLSAPLFPSQEINGRHGWQARNVSPVWLAKLHILARDGPERRLLRRLAGPGPNCYGATSRREEVWAWAWAIGRSHPQPSYQTKFATGTSAASNCSTSTWR